MDTKQPDAIRIAEWLEGIRGNTWPSYIPQDAAAELRRQHAEIETLRASYDAALDEIASLQARVQELGKAARDVNSRRVQELEAQLEAVGAGGVELLRKRECLHQISEPAQAAPASIITASVMRDDGGGHPAFCLMVAYRAEKDAKAALAMLTDEPAQAAAPDMTDAYAGAREDLAIWKKRALEAEALNRKFAASVNSPSFMGEPAALAQAGEYPPLPDCKYTQSGDIKDFGLYSTAQMLAYVAADRAARGAAKAAPAEAENEIDLLAEAALCERLDACLAAARAAQGVK